jgi:hypothetical protein
MKTLFLVLVFLSLMLQSIKAQNDTVIESSNNSSLQSASITQVITDTIVWSDIIHDNFKIYISLPENYNRFREDKYPVVYFLDGGSPTFQNIAEEYMVENLIPDIITIGIGYPETSQRNRDYTYGFLNFYQFLKQELIPLVDQRFNTNPNHRTLFGHSFGGFCALSTMFQYFDYTDILFQNIIAASPSIWWPDEQLLYTRESELFAQTQILPVNLFMTVGSLEGTMVTDLIRMQQLLKSRQYEYFNITYRINENEDHSTNKELTFREGIQWVFQQEVQIPDQTNAVNIEQNPVGIMVYPNPANTILKVKLANSKKAPVQYELINTSGKQVSHGIFCQPESQLNVSGFTKGLYFLKIQGNEFHSVSKFVVE